MEYDDFVVSSSRKEGNLLSYNFNFASNIFFETFLALKRFGYQMAKPLISIDLCFPALSWSLNLLYLLLLRSADINFGSNGYFSIKLFANIF